MAIRPPSPTSIAECLATSDDIGGFEARTLPDLSSQPPHFQIGRRR